MHDASLPTRWGIGQGKREIVPGRPPNLVLEATLNSFRSSLAPAIGRGSPRALGSDRSPRCLVTSWETRTSEEGFVWQTQLPVRACSHVSSNSRP